jgi:hypothetical protein
MFLFSCVSGGLAVGCSPILGVLPTIFMIQSFRFIWNGNRQKGLIVDRKKKKFLIEGCNSHWGNDKRVEQDFSWKT